ncbi:MAG: hypothetical protein KKB62_03540 [Nanoarchaeota archaeon]|jgi:hypothetical protein|nr:hypothetical protein [Nanoarchaeota archaeon]
MALIEQILFPNTFGMELVYSFVIIFCSLIVYFSTKKMYDISKHPGIRYFRISFLFFALAYFFKSFISFLLVFSGFRGLIEFLSVFPGVTTVFLFMYTSTMAIFYLLYSIVWKKTAGEKFLIPLVHALVLVISFGSLLIRSAWVIILLQILLFSFIAIYNYASYRKLSQKKKTGSIHVIYLFLFLFWMLNLSDILIANFSPFFEFLISLVSIGIFLIILYKVTKNVGLN